MDLSELQLKINKEKPISELKGVEQQLNKTGSAADNLIDTLKNVGLSIGFGKLLKDSLSLNSSFDALNNKFNSIFKSGFDGNVFAQLKEDITVSDSALKNILSTTGQFAAGMNQSSQFVRQFSADLTKAAADYATYQGKNTSSEINDYARKFAKATLGEVGELKEIGIVIDTTSKQFKNAVTEFATLNRVTEQQAKQQIIFKEILEQTQIAAGSAAGNINDGWAQLNRLFDNFKEILGEVGKIFSDTFGPILRTLNALIEIPFIKYTSAWVIAIGSISTGYFALIKTLRNLTNILKEKNVLLADKEVYSAQLKLLKLYEKQAKVQSSINEMRNKLANAQFDIDNPNATKSAKNKAAKIADTTPDILKRLDAELTSNENSIENFKNSIIDLNEKFKKSNISLIDMISSLDGITVDFETFVKAAIGGGAALATVTSATKANTVAETANTIAKNLNTAATYGQTAALKVQTFSRLSFGNLFGGLFKVIGGLFKKLFGPIATLFGKFFTTIFAGGLKAGFATLGLALGKFLLIVGAVAAAIYGIKKIWDFFTAADEIKEGKELDKKLKGVKDFYKEISRLRTELDELNLDRKIKNLIPSKSIRILEKQYNELQNKFKNANERIQALKYDERSKDDESLMADKISAQRELNDVTKKLYEVEDKIAEARKKQIEIDQRFIKSMEEIRKKISGVSESFNYGYKNGKFGNYTEDAKYQNTLNSIDRFKNFNFLSDTTEEGLNTAKEKLNEYFDLIKSKNEYELNALNKQREAAISTFEKTKEILNSISGYRVTAQTAISANSSEAIKLQSRRFESMTENRQLIQEQKQIKEIELRMLEKQKESKTTLEKIGNKLSEITNKIGKAQGANINIVPAL